MPPDKPRLKNFKVAAFLVFAGLAAILVYAHYRAADLLSDALSARVGVPVTVGLIDVGASSGITIRDISVENPPGYNAPYLARIKGINVRPDYKKLVKGDLSVGNIRIYGPELFLEKDTSGTWNAKRVADSFGREKGQPQGPVREFYVGRVELAEAAVNLPEMDVSVHIDAEIEGLSNSPGAAMSFSLEASDDKSAEIKIKGTGTLLSPEQQLDAVLSASVADIGAYLKDGQPKALKDASLDADIEFGYSGGRAGAGLRLAVRGVSAGGGKMAGPLDAGLDAELEYDRATDALLIKSAALDVPGVQSVGLYGKISSVLSSPVGEIYANTPDIDLDVLKQHMPQGFNVSGVASIRDVYVKGPLRPFTAEAGGRLDVNRLSAGYKGKRISGASGGATLSYAGGRASGRLDFRLMGGGITGGFGYSGDGGSFRVSAIKLLPSDIEGLPEGIKGTVDAQVEGVIGPGLKDITADYALTVESPGYGGKFAAGSLTAAGRAVKNENGLSASAVADLKDAVLPDKGAALSGASVTVKAASSGGELKVSGDVSVSGVGYKFLRDGALSGEFTYGGAVAALSGLKYSGEGIFAAVNSVTAAISGNKINVLAEGGEVSYKDGKIRLSGLGARLDAVRGRAGKLESLECGLTMQSGDAYGLALTNARGRAAYDGSSADAAFGLSLSGNPVKLSARAEIGSEGLKKQGLSGNLDIRDLASLAPAFGNMGVAASPLAGSLEIALEAHGEGGAWNEGSAAIKLSGLSAGTAERTLLSGVSAELSPVYSDGELKLPRATVDFGGYFSLGVSASAVNSDGGWSVKAEAELPRTGLAAVQEGVLEALPPKLMWADTAGDVGAALTASYSRQGGAMIDGSVELFGARIDLPDMGLSIGPADGRLPLGLFAGGAEGAPAKPAFRGEVFDREHYPELMRSYAAVPDDADIVIDKIRYGFVELESVTLDLEPGDGFYDINWFGLYAFDGRLVGYGRADLEGGRHSLSLIMSDFSLTELCDTVPAIKGYLSGRVDGLMRLVLAGRDYKGVTGASRFWAEDGPDEEREISKEFIKKLMGSSMKKYMSLFIGDRYFDTGELDIVFSKGNLVFENLLIANTNFLGQHDLNITVAPVSNRITIEHLLEVIRDVKARARR